MIKTVLFDLDGTLTDSGEGIFNAVEYALKEMGYPVPDGKTLRKFIGPPLEKSFQNFCGMDEDTSWEAVRQFRVYYNVTGIWENRVYDGIPELLEKLSRAGKDLVLATSKPEVAAIRVLEHFGLSKWITKIVGSTPDPSRATKGKVIGCALEDFGIDPADAVMVGDREHDVHGAAENGLKTFGVTYGYGSREELLNAGAAAVADTPEELYRILMEE